MDDLELFPLAKALFINEKHPEYQKDKWLHICLALSRVKLGARHLSGFHLCQVEVRFIVFLFHYVL